MRGRVVIATLLAGAFACGASGGARAQGWLGDRTVEVSVTYAAEIIFARKTGGGLKVTSRSKDSRSETFRLFETKEFVVFSQPDVKDGAIHTGGQARTKFALRAPWGRAACKTLGVEAGEEETHCLQMTRTKSGAELRHKVSGELEADGTFAADERFRVDLTANGCHATALPAERRWEETAYWDGSNATDVQLHKLTPRKVTCRVLAGRKAF